MLSICRVLPPSRVSASRRPQFFPSSRYYVISDYPQGVEPLRRSRYQARVAEYDDRPIVK